MAIGKALEQVISGSYSAAFSHYSGRNGPLDVTRDMLFISTKAGERADAAPLHCCCATALLLRHCMLCCCVL